MGKERTVLGNSRGSGLHAIEAPHAAREELGAHAALIAKLDAVVGRVLRQLAQGPA